MKYKVKDADSESQRSTHIPDNSSELEEKLARTVRCSSVVIAALGLSLVALGVYTTVLLLTEDREPQPCLSEVCVGTARDNKMGPHETSATVRTNLRLGAHVINMDPYTILIWFTLINNVFGYPLLDTNEYCLSDDCFKTASRILSALNRSVEPCNDFYEFACGGWIQKNPVPEWATSWDQLAVLREKLVVDLKELLEDKEDDGLPKSVLKAKALYRTCMDVDKLEESGIKPISSLLSLLGLPAAPPATPSGTFSWEETAGRARRRLGLSVLLSLQVAEDVRNTSRNRVVFEQVSPGFSDRYLREADRFAFELQQYRVYITAMVAAADPHTDAPRFADDIIEFSKSLANIMTPVEVRRSGTHLFHELTLSQLLAGNGAPQQWHRHDWQKYIDLVFSNTSVSLSGEERVIVMDLPYLHKLCVLLDDTRPGLVERFLWWSVFSTVAPMTLAQFRTLGFEFSRAAFGLRARAPRHKACAANVNANYGLALSYLYVQKHFDGQSRQRAIEMIEDVRSSFADATRSQPWMDDSTRDTALHKLQAIRTFVGFPAWLMDKQKLDDHYKHVEVSEGNLFESYLKLTWATVKKSLESLRETPDRNRWVATPTTVNAFYSATLNSVTFPAGILQPPFYGNGIEAINYGSIGAIMGHEVTHGFDDQGRRYDAQGNLASWWSAATLEHYRERVRCIVEQYDAYRLPQLPDYGVHGFNTQGENIADNGGLRAALRALQRRRRPAPALLPGLARYTTTQLFFLGFAQIWCGNSTVGALKSKMVEGVHSPNKIRVIGTLSNSKEFSEAWQCPLGSPMNPEHKCVLW